MKTAILIHGWPDKKEYFDPSLPSSSNRHWLPWLQQQLSINGILAQTPEMPEAWEPRYEKWKETFEQFDVNENTTLVGHSCGAGFLIRWLSENKTKVGPVMLVAPWLDPGHEERVHVADFFDFVIDPALSDRTDGVSIFISEDDEPAMLKSVEMLEKTLKGCRTIGFKGRGHFVTESMKNDEFPELLKEILL
jgi:predicted alpha/beta hydrolase family esterase